MGIKSGKECVNGMSPARVENNVCGGSQSGPAGEGQYCLRVGQRVDFTLTLVQYFPSKGTPGSWKIILRVTVEEIIRMTFYLGKQ